MSVNWLVFAFSLALVGSILAALIILVVRKPAVGLWILLGLVVVAIGGILLMIPVRTMREVGVHESSARATVARDQSAAASVAPGSGLDDAWEGDELQASVYPSQATAMKGIVARFAPAIEDALLNRPEAPVFRISTLRSAPEARSLRANLGEALVAQFAGAECKIEETPQAMPLEGEIAIQLEIVSTRTRNSAPLPRSEFNATIRATLIPSASSRADKRPSVTVGIEDKPWAANPRQFMDSDRGRWIVGRSGRPQSPEHRAITEAFEQAADSLMPMVREAVGRQRSTWSGNDEAWLREQVRARVAHPPLYVDRFVQPLTLSSTRATVWRSAVLIDAREHHVANLSRELVVDLHARDSRLKNTIFSTAGLALVIVLVYLLMNALTKGYYVWPLRVLAAALLVGGLVLLASFA